MVLYQLLDNSVQQVIVAPFDLAVVVAQQQLLGLAELFEKELLLLLLLLQERRIACVPGDIFALPFVGSSFSSCLVLQ